MCTANNLFNNVSAGNYSGDGSILEDGTSGSGSSGVCPSEFQVVTECLPSYVCGGSASVERGFVTEFTRSDLLSCNPFSNDTEQRTHNIQMNNECVATEPYL